MKIWLTLIVFFSLLLAILFGSQNEKHSLNTASDIIEEVEVVYLKLSGDISNRKSEISGLDWYRDHLIILPQYPGFPNKSASGRIFAIKKQTVLDHINNTLPDSIEPVELKIEAPDLHSTFHKFEGFEAIAFDWKPGSNRLWLSVEVENKKGNTLGYLVKGTIDKDFKSIKIDTTGMVKIESQSNIDNMAEESLLLMGDRLISIHEANRPKAVIKPVVNVFNKQLEKQANLSMFPLPYRITDATSVDGQNRFWTINTFYPKDLELAVGTDTIIAKYGAGETHKQVKHIERLVEFQYIYNQGIRLTNTPPIQLEVPLELKKSRNWEGIARLDSLGFLIATDKFPETILGFVPFKN